MDRDSNSILFRFSLNPFTLLLFVILALGHFNGYFTYADSPSPPFLFDSLVVSSFNYPDTSLKHYDWRYIKVDVPPGFSTLSVELESDANIDLRRISKISKTTLPVICFRDGSLPLPDYPDDIVDSLVLESLSNTSIVGIQGFQNKQRCYPMQKNMTVTLTNEQIYPGIWYIGLFNGIGATRTQGKMINRGNRYTISANVSVAGCAFPNSRGQHCNQTVESLTCAQSFSSISLTSNLSTNLHNQTAVRVVSCNSSEKQTCLTNTEQKLYLLETGLAEQLIISVADVKLNGSVSLKKTSNSSGLLRAYARYGAMPSPSMYDYVADIGKGPLIIQSPKVGNWYVSIVPGNITRSQGENGTVCYSMVSEVVECPDGKAGFNCSWNRYKLQTVLQRSPFDSYYIPIDANISSDSEYFFLEPLLSNTSMGNQTGIGWTYFTLDVPRTGGNLRFWLSAGEEIRYEVYARYGGLPTDETWDYYYKSKTNSSAGSSFFMVNNTTKETIDFYILFAREGTWNFAVKHPNSSYYVAPGDETTMSINVERCANDCSSPHGSCSNLMDENGLTVYSYCSCDRTHGGFDCSTEIISPRGHKRQSVFLIASNVAAILPAFWSLRQKAFAEWVIYTSSGISSGLYHACDVGTWCALGFHVLQFMDFWLSFMAVISTFIYMASIDEASKRTIHAAVSILTALLAVSGATRSSNIVLVIAIGGTGLLVGWLIELSTKYRSMSFVNFRSFRMVFRRQAIILSLRNLLKRFRWGFVIAGFVTLAMAGLSWQLESSESYWIWHSFWHMSIYTSSFLFLCSKASPVICDNQRSSVPQSEQQYELARQDSVPRIHLEG